MWESQESAYNLIKPPVKKKKKSLLPQNSADHALRTTAVRNLIWRMKDAMKLREAATFGYLPGSRKPQTNNFLLKHSKEPQLPIKRTKDGGDAAATADRCLQARKPPLPTQPPKHGLGSHKNWITENAVKVLKAKPNKSHCPKKENSYVEKANYGRIPMYLLKRKQKAASLKAAKDSPENQGQCHHPGARRLDEQERQEMVRNLKLKWANMNAEYMRLTFAADTDSSKERKERYERELENLERDVQLLSRKVILVSESSPPLVKLGDL